MAFKRENIYFHVKPEQLLDNLDRLLDFDFNYEILARSDFLDSYTSEDIDKINHAFSAKALRKRIHAPFVDLNPGSADKLIRKVSSERLLSSLELCKKLKSSGLIFHTHYEPIFYHKHFNEWINNAKDTWSLIEKRANAYGVTVCIENSLDDEPKAVLEMLKQHPSFKACFDVAHYNVFCEKGWQHALKLYPVGSIKEIHLSDNNGVEDNHFALGEGSIDIVSFLKCIESRNENPIITIEPHSEEDLIKNIDFINKYII